MNQSTSQFLNIILQSLNCKLGLFKWWFFLLGIYMKCFRQYCILDVKYMDMYVGIKQYKTIVIILNLRKSYWNFVFMLLEAHLEQALYVTRDKSLPCYSQCHSLLVEVETFRRLQNFSIPFGRDHLLFKIPYILGDTHGQSFKTLFKRSTQTYPNCVHAHYFSKSAYIQLNNNNFKTAPKIEILLFSNFVFCTCK